MTIESGYYNLESLAKLKSMTVSQLKQAYLIVEGADEHGRTFYNVKPATIHNHLGD